MSDKVKIISAFDGRCGIDNSDLHISRRWPARGSYVTLDKNIIEELMFDDAFKNMIEDGTLFIEDFELKKELGIEPEDAKAPTVIYLGDKELERFWKVMPLAQFKMEVKKLKKAQIESLADYAMNHGEDGSIPKANFLTEVSGRNILKGIELKKAAQEG